MTFSNGVFSSTGAQTAAESQTVVVRAKSEHNQTGVTASYNLQVTLNALGLSPATIKFYSGSGAATKSLGYTTTNPVTPAWSMVSGTLPTGVSFSNGTFSSDASQTVDETAEVGIKV